MQISSKDWQNYVDKLSKLSKKASESLRKYIEKYGTEDSDALIEFCKALIDKYGEGSAELTCQMYDAIAEMQNAMVPAAVPAQVATIDEVAKAVTGTKDSQTTLEGAIERLVKLASTDTMAQNIKRDKAKFAWVARGDTCPYCMMLSAIGWQDAGKLTMNGNHAEHVHAHCDCTYAVDFKGNLTIKGYNPGALNEEIAVSMGYDPDDYDVTDLLSTLWDSGRGREDYTEFNVLRRAQYAKSKDLINAQKRAAYAKRIEETKGDFGIQ